MGINKNPNQKIGLENIIHAIPFISDPKLIHCQSCEYAQMKINQDTIDAKESNRSGMVQVVASRIDLRHTVTTRY